MKTFLPLFVGLAGWFLVAVLVLSTLFGSLPQRPSRVRSVSGAAASVSGSVRRVEQLRLH